MAEADGAAAVRAEWHTPGPWEIAGGRGNTVAIIAREWEVPLVANVTANDRSEDEALANARLIAAAPEMLAALKETVLQLQYLADKFGETGSGAQVLARVNAAIAAATGVAQ